MEHLHRAARHIADQGRGPDSHLMHVSTNELKALGRLHPSGNVPRNPRTGLPEAGFLDQILPMVVGLGATIASGGAAAPAWLAAMNPATVGAVASGLTSTAMTGDIGKGLMTGLLSYGAGNALNGLADSGASALGAGAQSGVGQGTGELAGQTFAQTTAPAASGLNSTAASTLSPGVQNTVQNFVPGSGTLPPMPGLPPMGGVTAPLPAPTTQIASNLTDVSRMPFGDKLSSAATNLQSDPGGTLSRAFLDSPLKTSLPLVVGYAGSSQEDYEPTKEPTSAEVQRRHPAPVADPEQYRYQGPPTDYNTGNGYDWDFYPNMAAGGGVHGYYAKGGIADANPAASAKANIAAEAKMALMDYHPNAKQALRRYADAFGEDALKSLTHTVSSMGGRIRGAGGGLDDLIPGTIEGRKEVRLADGEFVVPADVVSHLGDGSSDHGVRKLTEMMDRIRKVKTGTEKQAGHIKDHKVLPA